MICPRCGYEPMEGRDGYHSCRERLQARAILEALRIELEASGALEAMRRDVANHPKGE